MASQNNDYFTLTLYLCIFFGKVGSQLFAYSYPFVQICILYLLK